MTAATSLVESLIRGIGVADEVSMADRELALEWVTGTDDIYRRIKPGTPSPHLVSYCLIVDRSAPGVLLCDHRLAGLWLPTGGHVEPGEHPFDAACREASEELGVAAAPDARTGAEPFFLTVTETVGATEDRHVDVTLWFALAGRVGQPLRPDDREFAEVRWWTVTELYAADRSRHEPHLMRALGALGVAG